METMARLLKHQEALLHQIEATARMGDVSAVLQLQRKLETLAPNGI